MGVKDHLIQSSVVITNTNVNLPTTTFCFFAKNLFLSRPKATTQTGALLRLALVQLRYKQWKKYSTVASFTASQYTSAHRVVICTVKESMDGHLQCTGICQWTTAFSLAGIHVWKSSREMQVVCDRENVAHKFSTTDHNIGLQHKVLSKLHRVPLIT